MGMDIGGPGPGDRGARGDIGRCGGWGDSPEERGRTGMTGKAAEATLEIAGASGLGTTKFGGHGYGAGTADIPRDFNFWGRMKGCLTESTIDNILGTVGVQIDPILDIFMVTFCMVTFHRTEGGIHG